MDKKLSILVSNDDGIFSDGIGALIRELQTIADVTVVAPETQQSAVGHAITVHRPLRVREVQKDGKFFGFAVDGTPADCVKLAIRHLMPVKPDLVVSGINHGSNTAISVIYSGTVSAATEGTILGIPSFAVSLTSFESNVDYSYAAKFSRTFALQVIERGLPNGTMLNVNIPPLSEKEIQGIVITRQGKSVWNDEFEARRDPGNRQYFWLKGELVELDEEEDIDQRAILNNKISVTPIQFDLTDYKMIEQLKGWKIGK
ncbi:MAG: 5'/3'-nucleotidase SurE [Ignavibacteriales bacterium]|nr:5'/3'-nucleotidase SurE [Ignavibacteriales bacterium]